MKRIIGVAVKAIIYNEGKVLVLQRAADESYAPGEWEFPGGKLEHGEDVIEGLAREAFEESNLSIKRPKILYASNFSLDEKRDVVVICYLCEINTDSKNKIKLSIEHQNYKWVNLDDLEKIFQPSIYKDLDRFDVIEIIKQSNFSKYIKRL